MNHPATPAQVAAFFDLDKTVIAKSSTLAFSRSFFAGGLINRRAVVRSAYGQLVYLLGGAGHNRMEKLRDQLSTLVAGWDAHTVRTIVTDALHYVIDPLVYDEAVDLIDGHQRAGHDVVLVSSAGEELVGPIGAMLGVDHVIATRMEICEGRYTGIMQFYAYGAHKVEAIGDLARREGYDLDESYAYSDSITDLPMLKAIGRPRAVNPDRALRRTATQEGWPIAVFAKPLALRSRGAFALPASRSALAAAVLGTGAAAVCTVWAARGQNRRTRVIRRLQRALSRSKAPRIFG